MIDDNQKEQKETLNTMEKIVYSMGKRRSVNTIMLIIMLIGGLITIITLNFWFLAGGIAIALVIELMRKRIYKLL
jgi:hypothetical protein